MASAEYQLHRDFESDYPEVVIRVGKITFGEEQRNIKDRQLKSELEEKLKSQATTLNQAACALLNSGGGVIRTEIENEDYSYKRHRIGLDIEDSFRDCIQHKDFSAYFDFKQEESCMSIFVKSWSSENPAYPRVCSLDTGLYERSSSSAVKMKPANVVHFLKSKKDDAKRGSKWQEGPDPANVQKCLQRSGVEMEKDINDAVDRFFERERLDLGEILDFTESTTVEFKDLSFVKDNYEFVRKILPRYASAFANTKGGYLIFGVDNHRKVVGCKQNIDPSQFVQVVGETIAVLPTFHFCASEKKVEFLCKALPVYDIRGNGEEKKHGYVFAVRIKPSCCIVFERKPDSWIMEAGEVKRLTYTEWIVLMTEKDPDVSHFADGFQIELSRSCRPPLSKSVYSNRGLTCVKTLQSTLFPVNPDGITCKPEEICEEVFLEYPRVKDVIMKKIEEVSSVGILIFSRSWAVDVGLEKHPQVACDILLVAADSFPTLYTVIMDKGYSVSSTIPVVEYSRNVACTLKQKLVNEGGYAQKVCVIPQVIELGSNGEIKTDLRWPVTYPPGYLVSRDGLEELLQALVIALLRFRSFLSDQIGCEFLNLLTIKQYEILTKNLHKSKKLFIYGLPGSGKTVVALQIIEKIMNTFHCNSGEILYICENIPLCKTVRVGNMCQTVTRIDFLKGAYSQPVKHIVIDEAQNFQLTDGDWYGKAVKLTEVDPHKPGVLWIFLDYLQTSHTQVSGLPDASKQEPQEWLTTGVRNATQVYKVMMHLRTHPRARSQRSLLRLNIPYEQLNRLVDETQCGHSLLGVFNIRSLKGKDKIVTRAIVHKCLEYFEKGYSVKNIAILCSTVEERDIYRRLLEREMSNHLRGFGLNVCFTTADVVEENGIVVDTIHHFSGLERSIVFAVFPYSESAFLIPHLLVCMVSRANLHCHILLERSKRFRYVGSQNILLDSKLVRKQHLMQIMTDWEDSAWEDSDWKDMYWEDLRWEDKCWEDTDWEDTHWEDKCWEDTDWEDTDWEDIDWEDTDGQDSVMGQPAKASSDEDLEAANRNDMYQGVH
uniref:schlafen family member 13-like n=1 Tax=Euleptes europaea TaxID=460621 RepID=UPI0025412325|nr:schlafen family member 13-like [Euleptes europaea]